LGEDRPLLGAGGNGESEEQTTAEVQSSMHRKAVGAAEKATNGYALGSAVKNGVRTIVRERA
jgi:hypothetical protein